MTPTHAATASWRLTLLGLVLVGAGFVAIVVASIQGMALVPGGSFLDGYSVGLLPWTDVGTWLVPIGGVVATVGALASIALGRPPPILRLATISVIVVVLFWALIAAIGMAPRNGPDGSTSTSSLATVVYSSPVNTVLFLLVPAAIIVAIAAVFRRQRPAG